MIQLRRTYRGSTIQMLTVAATLIQNAIIHQQTLVKKHPHMTMELLEELLARILSITKQYMGVDKNKNLRAATQTVAIYFDQATEHLSDLNLQLERYFRKQPELQTELFTQLGLTKFYPLVLKGSQDAMVQLLYQIEENIGDYKDALIGNKVSPDVIEGLLGLADQLHQANIAQEQGKGAKKEGTAERKNTFQDLYDEVMDIVLVAAKDFKDDKAIHDKFVYTQLLDHLKFKTKNTASPVAELP